LFFVYPVRIGFSSQYFSFSSGLYSDYGFQSRSVLFENYLYLSTPPNRTPNSKKNQIGKRTVAYNFARPTGTTSEFIMGNWGCSSYKKKKAKNQRAGHNLKIVHKL
jgi:hypothetical protein